MKGIILAGLIFVLLILLLAALLIFVKPREKFRSMLAVFAGTCIFFIVIYLATPKDLGFLGAPLLKDPAFSDFLNGFFLLQIFFWLFVFQPYSLVSRGFSLGILIEIEKAGLGGLDFEEVKRRFADGRGVDSNFDDKLADSVRSGLVRVEGAQYLNTWRGNGLAWIGARLKSFFKTGPGG